ncbi:ABC transporter ATP-binding protein [Rhodoferax sp.]|jgi:branched-chain amino acid transport system ATP-binding protein|uniref:ABC transporter ATP-binding protein n=1 Tax=Rhodoferax sp. TaxID=50421 RepID=UPI003783400C
MVERASLPVLELRGLSKRFGSTEVIRGANLVVHPGERVAIIGPNGAGKSTLFDLVTGRYPPSDGQILLHQRPLQGLPPHQIHRLGVARSFQITQVFPKLTVTDNLRCAALWHLGYRAGMLQRLTKLAGVNTRVQHLLDTLGLQPLRDLPAAALAYADQRALDLGMALAGDAPVLLLDEPTAGMGRGETQRMVARIREATQGKTLLMVEHDMEVVFGLADKVAVLVSGAFIAVDTPERVRADPKVQAAYLGALDVPSDRARA